MNEQPASEHGNPITVPRDSDLAEITHDKVSLLNRLLSLIEDEVVPLTQKGVREGNKLFGGAIIRKSDLSTLIAATNSEMGNPLLHGEIVAINAFYELPGGQREPVKDCIFVSTHEPCPLCLSAIAWGGFDNFFYLFSYEDSKDAFNIPHDLRMQEEIFRVPDGNYAKKNCYWSSWGIRELISSCPPPHRDRLDARAEALRKSYSEMSKIYQESKDGGSAIPLS